MIGGKLTTYRELAAQAVDAVVERFGRPTPPSRTDRLPLPGARVADGDFAHFRSRFPTERGLLERTADHPLRVYGARAADVLALAEVSPDLAEPFAPLTGAIGAELVWAFRAEGAETLADALLRRTMVGLGPEVGLNAVAAAAEIGRPHLGWDAAHADAEVARYREHVARFTPKGSADAVDGTRAGVASATAN